MTPHQKALYPRVWGLAQALGGALRAHEAGQPRDHATEIALAALASVVMAVFEALPGEQRGPVVRMFLDMLAHPERRVRIHDAPERAQ